MCTVSPSGVGCDCTLFAAPAVRDLEKIRKFIKIPYALSFLLLYNAL